MSVNNDRNLNKKRLIKKNLERIKYKEIKIMKLVEIERMKGKKERENYERLCV